jgi:hypothetical protein
MLEVFDVAGGGEVGSWFYLYTLLHLLFSISMDSKALLVAFVSYRLKYNWHLVILVLEHLIIVVLYLQLSIWKIIFYHFEQKMFPNHYVLKIESLKELIFF